MIQPSRNATWWLICSDTIESELHFFSPFLIYTILQYIGKEQQWKGQLRQNEREDIWQAYTN